MTKEDFQNTYGRYSIAEAAKEKPDNPNLRQNLEGLLINEIPNLPTLKSKPSDEVVVTATKASELYQGRLVDYVNGNIDNLVADITDEKNALALILGFKPNLDSDEAKLIKEIQADRELLQDAEKDPEAVEKIFKVLLESDVGGILKTLFDYNPDRVMESYNGLIGVKQRILANKFAKDGQLDMNAVNGYLSDNLRAVPEEEKIKTYTGFANIVAKTYQEQEEKAKQAKKEK